MTDPSDGASQSDDHGDTADAASPGASDRVEQALSYMVEEPMLRPLLIVVLFHAVAFLMPVLLFGLRDRNLAGLAGIAVLVVATGSGVHRDWQARHLRVLTGFILATWLFAAIGAWLGNAYGII